MIIQSIARIALALLLLGGIVFALLQHGKQLPARRYHAAEMVAGGVVEVVLVWLAGGWGI